LLQTRARHLNLLQAGEEDAHYMGVDVKRTQHQLLILSALLADTLARTLVVPAEMPVGLLTSLIGGPWFLWLILRQQRGL
ncbi:iron chelate uptake ABC transporter family permease subunit, partial [Pantoea agglomerans]|uniref:iron chelate uptake ABC transporter family permease subunit n=1 Tax=Enterobacter agglomerans TaxID=549 RepID=UPI001A8F56E8